MLDKLRSLILGTTTMVRRNRDKMEAMAVDLVRLQLLLDGAALAQARGVRLAVVIGNVDDNGNLTEDGLMIRKALESVDALALAERKVPIGDNRSPLYHSRQQVLREGVRRFGGTATNWVGGWIEDGKIAKFLSQPCLPSVCHALDRILDGSVDFVTFNRGDMPGYPQVQRELEQAAADELAAYSGLLRIDPFVGPFFGSCMAIDSVLEYQGDHGDHWETTCVLQPYRQMARGFRVADQHLPFTYPLGQFFAEDGVGEMERKREIQQGIVSNVMRYIDDERRHGNWPPKSDFVAYPATAVEPGWFDKVLADNVQPYGIENL